MTPLFTVIPRCWLLAASLAWLAVALPERTAEASCGDWLVVSHEQSRTFSDTKPDGRSGASDDFIPASEAPEAPCHGPDCKSRKPIPVSPVPGFNLPTHRDDGVFGCLTAWADQGEASFYPADEDAEVQRGFPLKIEYPP